MAYSDREGIPANIENKDSTTVLIPATSTEATKVLGSTIYSPIARNLHDLMDL